MGKENNFHSTIKFTADMSETEIMLLDTKVCKGVRFDKESILDVQTNFYLQNQQKHSSTWTSTRVTHQV